MGTQALWCVWHMHTYTHNTHTHTHVHVWGAGSGRERKPISLWSNACGHARTLGWHAHTHARTHAHTLSLTHTPVTQAVERDLILRGDVGAGTQARNKGSLPLEPLHGILDLPPEARHLHNVGGNSAGVVSVSLTELREFHPTRHLRRLRKEFRACGLKFRV